MQKYLKQSSPVLIPGDDNKKIEEFFGLVSTGNKGLSLAHMLAYPHWEEPHQFPEFDEITIMVSGKIQFEIDRKIIILEVGECLWVNKNVRVKYSNPFDDPAEYWSICLPAFSPDLVHRE
ncbi:MAG: cupin [Calditrichota bacterium]|jgi:mannose-6-phosphate isomerase-like protein (cupin superfamily)